MYLPDYVGCSSVGLAVIFPSFGSFQTKFNSCGLTKSSSKIDLDKFDFDLPNIVKEKGWMLFYVRKPTFE